MPTWMRTSHWSETWIIQLSLFSVNLELLRQRIVIRFPLCVMHLSLNLLDNPKERRKASRQCLSHSDCFHFSATHSTAFRWRSLGLQAYCLKAEKGLAFHFLHLQSSCSVQSSWATIKMLGLIFNTKRLYSTYWSIMRWMSASYFSTVALNPSIFSR